MSYRCWRVGCNQIAVTNFLPSIWSRVSVDVNGVPIECIVEDQAAATAKGRVPVEFLVKLDDHYGFWVINLDLDEEASGVSWNMGKTKMLKDVRWLESPIGCAYKRLLVQGTTEAKEKIRRHLEIALSNVREVVSHL